MEVASAGKLRPVKAKGKEDPLINCLHLWYVKLLE